MIRFMGQNPKFWEDVPDHELITRLLLEQAKDSDYGIDAGLAVLEDVWRRYEAEGEPDPIHDNPPSPHRSP